MANHNARNTDDFEPKKITQHGQINFRREDNLLIIDATGPFSEGIVEAIAGVQFGLVSELASQGPWGDVIIFHKNATVPAQVMATFQHYLSVLVNNKVAACFTALVLPPDVVGSKSMQASLLQAYTSNGLTVSAFDQEDAAFDWVRAQLALTADQAI